MTVSLTSGFLATFLLSELRPVISRHHRFRDNDGSALLAFSNLISYKDVSLVIGSISADGNPFSPDSFVCTMLGRVCAAKLDGYNGSFIEWTRETTTEDEQPPTGVYYISIDAINEETKEVKVVLQPYSWAEGCKENAVGSRIYIDPRTPMNLVESADPAVEFTTSASYLLLLTYTDSLVLRRTDTNVTLIPGVDYWIQPHERHLLLTTAGGEEPKIRIPDGYCTIRLMDGDYELRQGLDWDWDGEGTVKLASWTQAGIDIYVDGTFRRVPFGNNVVNLENFIPAKVPGIGEELAPGQCVYSLVRGTYVDDMVWTHDGRICFRHLMSIGDRATWETRIKKAQIYTTIKKMSLNPDFLPGLTIAVGDAVELGDQMALVVFPSRCEIYEVYGGKEGLMFDIAIKSNDLLTSSELATMVKNYLLVDGRDRLESSGLSVSRISSNYNGEQRDSSGTTASHTVTLSVTASGDWEHWKPLINRVDDIELDFGPSLATYPGSPRPLAATVAFGVSRFTPSYQ